MVQEAYEVNRIKALHRARLAKTNSSRFCYSEVSLSLKATKLLEFVYPRARREAKVDHERDLKRSGAAVQRHRK